MAKILLAALGLIVSAYPLVAVAETAVEKAVTEIQHGVASFYAKKFEGRRTANGETFRHTAYTAAHPTLPFGTHALVTNHATGKSVIVRITDRMGSTRTLVDVSRAAAEKLRMLRAGRTRVTLQVLEGPLAQESLTR